MTRPIAAATLLALAVLPGSAVRGGEPSLRCEGGDRRSCDLILSATRAFAGMLATADPAPLRRHLDPRALWITADGDIRSGRQLIDTVRRDARRATAALDDAEIRFSGDIAVVRWRESWTAPGAAVTHGRLAGVDTWLRRGDRWVVVSTAETKPTP